MEVGGGGRWWRGVVVGGGGATGFRWGKAPDVLYPNINTLIQLIYNRCI